MAPPPPGPSPPPLPPRRSRDGSQEFCSAPHPTLGSNGSAQSIGFCSRCPGSGWGGGDPPGRCRAPHPPPGVGCGTGSRRMCPGVGLCWIPHGPKGIVSGTGSRAELKGSRSGSWQMCVRLWVTPDPQPGAGSHAGHVGSHHGSRWIPRWLRQDPNQGSESCAGS